MTRWIRAALVSLAVLSLTFVTPTLEAGMVERKATATASAEELSGAMPGSLVLAPATHLAMLDAGARAGQVEILIGGLLFAGFICLVVLLCLPGDGGGGGWSGGGSSSGTGGSSGSSGSGYTYPCRSCGGNGRCGNCNGGGRTSSGTCVWCGGNGVCGRCGGDGIDK